MSENQRPVMDRLQEAARGLLFTSETDAPLEPVIFPGAGNGPLDGRRILELTQKPARTPVQTLSVDEFFEPATREQSWQNAQERETVTRFQRLAQALKEGLADVQVLKLGKVESDVYVLGKTPDGDLAGIKTHVVET